MLARAPILVVIAMLAACSSSDDKQLREELADVRKEIRDVRQEIRDVRDELRDLRGPTAAEPDDDEPDDTATAEAPPLDAPDAGAAATSGVSAVQPNVKISLSSNPSGAKVYVGDRLIGTTPLLFQHEPGTEELRVLLEKEGYRPRVMIIRPEEDTKISVQLAKK